MNKCPKCAADLDHAAAPCGRCGGSKTAPPRARAQVRKARPLLWTLVTAGLVALSIPIGSLIGPTPGSAARGEQRRAIYNGILLGESAEELASRYQTAIEEIEAIRAEGQRKGWKLEDLRPKTVAEKVIINRNAIVRRFETSGLLVRRSCVGHEAHVQTDAWLALDSAGQRNVTSILAAWCAAQGGSNRMTMFDATSGRKLAALVDGSYTVSQP